MRCFGTDGIRGSWGTDPITEDFFYHIGRAVGGYLESLGTPKSRSVLAGRDTRHSGKALELAFAQGVSEFGFPIFSLGIMPTPAIARYTKENKGILGVAITASHNPPSDNGIKFFNHLGCKLSINQETVIEKWIYNTSKRPKPRDYNKIAEINDGSREYIDGIKKSFSKLFLKGKKVILDCSHGATSTTSPMILKTLGADLITLNHHPNGFNINTDCGSENPEITIKKVIDENATIGLAHDGDGDRIIFSDETGSLVNGDEILGILAVAKKMENPNFDTLVVTQQSNTGLDHSLEKLGIAVVRTDIGDRFVATKMREIGSSVGGESSGHIILSDFSPTGDGIVAALQILSVMEQRKMSLSELRKAIRLYPQVSKNIFIKHKPPLVSCLPILDCKKEIEESFNKRGRVLIRYSGTEPKLRILVECSERHLANQALQKLATVSVRCLT